MSPGGATVLYRALPKPLQFTSHEKRALRAFAHTLIRKVANGRPFVCVVSDDAELCRLNTAFLGRHYPTDVLSFPSALQNKLREGPISDLGEIIISSERAQSQADEFGHQRVDEICVLMLHGILHLLGFDHERDQGEMARAEREWRERLSLPSGLIARADTARLSR